MATRSTTQHPGQAKSDAEFLAHWRIWTHWDALRLPSWRNAVIAAAIALAVAIASAATVLAGPAQYVSAATLVIDSPAELASSANDGPIHKLNGLRGKYASLAGTLAILEPAADRLGIPVGDVARASITSPSLKSLLMTTAATTGDPARSQAIAQAVADSLVDYVEQEHVRANVPPAQRFSFSVVAPALPGIKSAPTKSRAALVAVGAAAITAVAAYAALQLFTARRRLTL